MYFNPYFVKKMLKIYVNDQYYIKLLSFSPNWKTQNRAAEPLILTPSSSKTADLPSASPSVRLIKVVFLKP
jgi:hypothetical protein